MSWIRQQQIQILCLNFFYSEICYNEKNTAVVPKFGCGKEFWKAFLRHPNVYNIYNINRGVDLQVMLALHPEVFVGFTPRNSICIEGCFIFFDVSRDDNLCIFETDNYRYVIEYVKTYFEEESTIKQELIEKENFKKQSFWRRLWN